MLGNLHYIKTKQDTYYDEELYVRVTSEDFEEYILSKGIIHEPKTIYKVRCIHSTAISHYVIFRLDIGNHKFISLSEDEVYFVKGKIELLEKYRANLTSEQFKRLAKQIRTLK